MIPDFSGLVPFFKFLGITILVLVAGLLIMAAPRLMNAFVDVTHRSESINQRPTGQTLCTDALKNCPHIQKYDASNFQQLVATSRVPVVCTYYIDSSQLCVEQLQLLEKISTRYSNKVRFLAADTAEVPMSCNVLSLKKVPATAVATKGNKEKEVRQMFLSEQELTDLITKATGIR